MSGVSPDTSRRLIAIDLIGAATTIESSSFLHLTNGLCFSSASKTSKNKMSRGKGITLALLEMQVQLCPE